MSENKSIVSVVVPNYGRPNKLLNCINSVFSSDYANLEIIVVDDPYSDGYASAFVSLKPSVIVIKNRIPKFVSGSRNAGAEVAKGEYIFFLDSDNIIERDTISNLVEVLSDEEVGIAAPLPYYATQPEKVWKTGEYRSNFLRFNRQYKLKELLSHGILDVENIANAFMIKKKLFKIIGGFDAINFPRDEGEPDIELRVRRNGYRTVIVPFAKTFHDIGISRLAHFTPDRLEEGFKSRFWFEKKHQIKKLPGLSVGVIILALYYTFLIVVEKDFKTLPDIKEKILAILRGIRNGLLFSPNMQ